MNTCATIERLELLLSGTLDETDAKALRLHVSQCSDCQGALDRLTDHPQLRHWARPETPPPTAGTAELQSLLHALHETPYIGAKHGDTTLPFLAPPEHEGDLGTLGSYRILAELGRGGMGIVLKAYDRELQRTVALKFLHPERAGEAARTRFVREARAAAGITHDHVVPVYAVVSPADGPPYFVMQYIAGPTLRERIADQKRLDPRAAAQLTLQAAGGLSAAHRAGLIHRDIKPANILLDESDGRAKITDFGLVRTRERTGDTTQENTIPGTPEYMSPEQIRAPEQIDERSDVYSLGVTMYEALTGAVPFRGAPQMVLQQVLHDDPIPPRRLSDQIPRDLETVCLKAMAKEPGRRYPNATALGDDLRCWLNGEPITARPVSALEKFWSRCRRNPAIASLAAGIVLALTGGLAVSAWQWQRADRQWHRAETNLVTANFQRDQAKESFQDARSAVDKYLIKISEEKLLDVSAFQPLRKELLEAALEYHQHFLNRRSDDPELQADVAISYSRIASIHDQLGLRAKALAAFREAIDRQERLVRDQPTNSNSWTDLSITYNNLGTLHHEAGSAAEARRLFQQARNIQEQLVEQFPRDPLYRRNLANHLANLASICQQERQFAEARGMLERSLALQKDLAREERSDGNARRNLAATHSKIGLLLIDTGQASEAVPFLMEARRLDEELFRDYPDDIHFRSSLGGTCHNLAMALLATNRLPEALAAAEQAIAHQKVAFGRAPQVTTHRHYLVRHYHLLADIQLKLGHPDEARRAHQHACEAWEGLVRDYPDILEFRSELGGHWHDFGLLLVSLKRHAEAEAALRRALDHQQLAFKKAPHVPQHCLFLQKHYFQLAHLFRQTDRPAEAAAMTRAKLNLFPLDADLLAYGAHELAECIPLVGKSKTALSTAEQTERNNYADEAMTLLRRAVSRGYEDLAAIQTEPAFEPLRPRPDFQKLLRELEQRRAQPVPAPKPK